MSRESPSSSPLPAASKGISIHVFGDSNCGDRPYMEDVTGIQFPATGRRQAFVAVFDGHGGEEAAQFADRELWSIISSRDGFNSTDSEDVKRAISEGFQVTHENMWSVRPSWKRRSDNSLSTAGTTASVLIIRPDRMFIANVGDSTVVLGWDPSFSEPCDTATVGQARESTPTRGKAGRIIAKVLTDDHKPDGKETKRIEKIGGLVLQSPAGAMRVAKLEKSQTPSGIKVRAMPFLAIARSLGDLWSYTEQHKDYFVSPVPDVSEYKLDISRDRFVVLASDGLWDVMTPQMVVEFLDAFCRNKIHRSSHNVARALINKALKRWKQHRADNISVIVVFFQDSIQTRSSNIEDRASPLTRGEHSVTIDSQSMSDGETHPDKGENTDLPGPSNRRQFRPGRRFCEPIVNKDRKDTMKSVIDVEFDITDDDLDAVEISNDADSSERGVPSNYPVVNLENIPDPLRSRRYRLDESADTPDSAVQSDWLLQRLHSDSVPDELQGADTAWVTDLFRPGFNSDSEPDNPSEPAVVRTSMNPPSSHSVPTSPSPSSTCSTGDRCVSRLGKRKAQSMSQGHSSSSAAPGTSKRSRFQNRSA